MGSQVYKELIDELAKLIEAKKNLLDPKEQLLMNKVLEFLKEANSNTIEVNAIKTKISHKGDAIVVGQYKLLVPQQ